MPSGSRMLSTRSEGSRDNVICATMTLRADHVAGGAAIAAALAVLAVSGDLPFGTLAFPGAGMMPKLVCALMIVLGAILVARGGTTAPFSEIGWSDLPHAIRVLAITAAAVALTRRSASS